MAVEISVPESPWATQEIALGGAVYTFVYSYNSRDKRWRLSILLDETPVISGVKIVGDERLLARHVLPDFDHGDLICLKVEDTTDPVGLGNLGIGKAYQLIYFSNEELQELSE